MSPNETKPTLESVHIDCETVERGPIETTTKQEYLLDRATGQVTYVETVDVDNYYPRGRSKRNMEMARKILTPDQVPAVVREKINALLGKKAQ